MALTKLNNQSISEITASGMPTGSVIQVVNTRSTTGNLANVAADYPVASGFKLSITPTSTSSKILVIFDLDVWLDAGANVNKIGKYGIRLNSQSNALVAEKRVGANFEGLSAGAASVDVGQQCTMTYLDSPNSTSPQEYEAMLGRWSSAYPNNVKINGGGFGHSSITLMEIAG